VRFAAVKDNKLTGFHNDFIVAMLKLGLGVIIQEDKGNILALLEQRCVFDQTTAVRVDRTAFNENFHRDASVFRDTILLFLGVKLLVETREDMTFDSHGIEAKALVEFLDKTSLRRASGRADSR